MPADPPSPAVSLPRIILINAALGGRRGNTASVLELARRHLRRRARVVMLTLAEGLDFAQCRDELASAAGYVFATGTHWDSWSSLLQRFLEQATDSEATRLWIGKPAACLVTEHSVGGKAVLSRLQGVLTTFGCEVPPMSGLVLSRAAWIAGQHAPEAAEDFWSTADLRVVCHNLIEAAQGTRRWRSWPVDRKQVHERWLPPPT